MRRLGVAMPNDASFAIAVRESGSSIATAQIGLGHILDLTVSTRD